MLTTLRHRAAAAGAGCASVSIEELNVVLDQHQHELVAVRESVRTLLRDARRWSDSEWYLIVGAEAYEAARAAGGPQ